MIGKKAGVVTTFKEKVQTANGGRDFWTFHCILHQEALCCKSLKMDNVMKVVVQTVNFIRSRGLNHRQFDSLLRENDHNHGLPYHTEGAGMASRVDDVMLLCCEISGHKEFEETLEYSIKCAGAIGGAVLVGGLVAGPVGVGVGGAVGGVLGSWLTWGKFKPLPQILMELTPAQKQKLYNDVLAVIGNLRWTDAAHLIALVMGNATLKEKVTTVIINYISKELSV